MRKSVQDSGALQNITEYHMQVSLMSRFRIMGAVAACRMAVKRKVLHEPYKYCGCIGPEEWSSIAETVRGHPTAPRTTRGKHLRNTFKKKNETNDTECVASENEILDFLTKF